MKRCGCTHAPPSSPALGASYAHCLPALVGPRAYCACSSLSWAGHGCCAATQRSLCSRSSTDVTALPTRTAPSFSWVRGAHSFRPARAHNRTTLTRQPVPPPCS